MNPRSSLAKRLIAGVTLACMASQTVLAAATDISSTPLSSGTTPVLPNVMFILDDSISMGAESLPDYTAGSPYNLDHTSLKPDAYLGGTNVNLTSSTFKVDRQYCNINSLCKRNGEV